METTGEAPETDDAAGAGAWSEPAIRRHRSPDDRYVAGVLGGLGERFDVDPTILRVATVAAAVALRDDAPALVPALYALGWLVVPVLGRRSLLATISQQRSLQEVAGAVVGAVLATFVVATPTLWVAGALAATAWLLLAERPPAAATVGSDPARPEATRPEPARSDPAPGPGAGPFPPTEAGPADAAAHGATGTAARWGRTRRGVAEPLRALRLRPVRPRKPRREPALWPLTLALLVAFTVACVAIDSRSDTGLDPAVFVNGALLIIGGVLALSGWRGRAGWTTLLAIPLLPLWIAFSATDIGRYDGTGSRSIDVLAAPDDGRLSVEHGYGDLDLTISERAVPAGETLQVSTAMTAGTTTIVVPDNASVVVRSHAGVGVVRVDGAGSPWATDAATVVSQHRRRSYPPVPYRCSTQQYAPAELQELYREWRGAPAVGSAAPDFTDADAAQRADVQDFLAAYLPAGTQPVADGDGVVWVGSWDDIGRPCDPDEPVSEAGTIEIDATIGVGEVHVVRHH